MQVSYRKTSRTFVKGCFVASGRLRRINDHLAGKVWTTSRMHEIKLVYYEAFLSKDDAMRRERYFKTSKGKISLRQIIRSSIQ